MFDLVLRNAVIVDGTGSGQIHGDIGILNGRISEIGTGLSRGEKEIDCRGLVASPGFIDVHAHYDAQVMWDPMITPSVNHGVTTFLAGNCGFTLAPLSGKPADADYLIRMLSRVEGMPLSTLRSALKPDWTSFGGYLDALDGKLAINAGFSVGHSALRRTIMGERAVGHAATDAEVNAMCALLETSLREGGVGFSTSVSSTHNDYEGEPIPSRWADRNELLRLAEVCSRHPGTWVEFAHGGTMTQDEVYELGTDLSLRSQRPVNWNLIVVDAARKHIRDAQLAAGDHARERGGAVYGLTPAVPPKIILNFLSGFVLDGISGWADVILLPHDEKIKALADPAIRIKLRENWQGMGEFPGAHHFREWGSMFIEGGSGEILRPWIGRTVADYAEDAKVDPLDAIFDLAVASELTFAFSPTLKGDDDESWLLRRDTWRDERALIGASDAGAHLDMINTFAFSTQLLGEGVRRRQLLPLEEAVYRITGLLADRFGIKGRGRLAIGMAADIVVFDPETVDCGPCEMRNDLPGGEVRITADALGIEYVIVNGVPVVANGKLTGDKGGKILRSGRDTETVALPGKNAEKHG